MRRVVTSNSRISAPIAQTSTARNGNSETVPAELVLRLKELGVRSKMIAALDYHHEALAVWRRCAIRAARVLHIDAHSDLYGIFHSWETDRVHQGNYLRFALEEGLVRTIEYYRRYRENYWKPEHT